MSYDSVDVLRKFGHAPHGYVIQFRGLTPKKPGVVKPDNKTKEKTGHGKIVFYVDHNMVFSVWPCFASNDQSTSTKILILAMPCSASDDQGHHLKAQSVHALLYMGKQ